MAVNSIPARAPNCCNLKHYKLRYFCSKGALLVIVWICLVSATFWSFVRLYGTLFQGLKGIGLYHKVALVPVVPFFALGPLYAWLADVHFGNYRVFKAGLYLLLLAAVFVCICSLVLVNIENESGIVSQVFSGGVSTVVYILTFTGFAACLVTALQLGLDQIPDASSASIISFIHWFLFSLFLGIWISDTVYVVTDCIRLFGNYWSMQIYSLFPVVCSCICFCSLFLLAPKWLTVEPNCPQSSKTIYRVLKFAAKHKAVLNCSAFTNQEKGVLSRMDVGKAKYGGPFTTEQVEDVKTFFKIMVIFLPVAINVVSMTPKYSFDPLSTINGLSNCTSELVYTFTYSPWWCSVVTIVIGELLVYPFLQNKGPSTLKCIGIAMFFVLLSNICFLIVSIVDLQLSLDTSFWLNNSYNVVFGVFVQYMLMKHFEFVCAQSPYSMRGLLAGYMLFLFFCSMGLGIAILRVFDTSTLCAGPYHCLVVQKSSLAALSLIGFILHCVLAHWYKWRVRDEDSNVHRVV